MTHPLDGSQPSAFSRQVLAVMTRYVSPPTARSVLDVAARRQSLSMSSFGPEHVERVATSVRDGMALFVSHPRQLDECLSALRHLAGHRAGEEADDSAQTSARSIEVVLRTEDDIVRARREARAIALGAGFTETARTRVTTAVSELARNIVRYAGEGTITLSTVATGNGAARVEIVAADRGPGIANLETILGGTYRSKHGMGLGLRGVKRIAESFEVQTAPNRGTAIFASMVNE